VAIIGAILAIGFLVLVHEAGHYLVARWCNMRVERFSIGFGPAIYSWPKREHIVSEKASGVDEILATLYRLARKRPRGHAGIKVGTEKLDYGSVALAALPLEDVRSDIEKALKKGGHAEAEVLAWEQINFTLAPIPFGGFVQIDGMALVEDIDPDDTRAYPNKPVWQRVATIFAGPGTNYLTALVLAFGLYSIGGVSTGVVEYTVEGFAEGYDAEGKLEVGDRIIAVNGVRATSKTGGLPGMVQRSKDKPIAITVLRSGEEVSVDIQAKPAPTAFTAQLYKDYHQLHGMPWPDRYLIGIQMTQHPERVDASIGASLKHALAYPVKQSEMILVGLWKIVSGQEKGEVGGPVLITQMIKRSIDYGWMELVSMLMLLNVYLGLFNLLPLPALDGGRLAFLGYEIITRRRPNPSVEQTVHAVGIMAFLVIMVLVTYKDILRLFS